MPFCRILIQTFVAKVNAAEKAAGGQGYVTIAALRD